MEERGYVMSRLRPSFYIPTSRGRNKEILGVGLGTYIHIHMACRGPEYFLSPRIFFPRRIPSYSTMIP
jgi:hypothetical protein